VRIFYRAHQFWRTVFLKTDHLDFSTAQDCLAPAQWALFSQLQPAEQAHALKMLHTLHKQGEKQPDLLVAALLHDVGKLRYRLNPVERALVVLAQAIIPHFVLRWGVIPDDGWEALPGWRKAFVVSEQHAEWGAQLAHKAGVSALAVALIRQHHQPAFPQAGEMENRLLHALWVVDNHS